MLSAIAKPFGWLMLVLYNFVNNYGLAVILFALIVRLILLPFSMKSKKSLMRSTRFQPLMKELEKKYEGNKQKYQEEVAKLYKEEGINPMGGCIWSLIPFPILLALYQAIRYPITIMMGVGDEAYAAIQKVLETLGFSGGTNSAYIQIAQSQFITQNFDKFAGISDKLQTIDYSFLGLDLGANPSFRVWEFFSNGEAIWPQLGLFLIPVISAALSYFSMVISNKASGNNTTEAAGGKTMMLMMPIMSLWIGFVMPGALGIYWIASSVFSILQDVVLTKHYKKILDAEDAERREKQAAIEAERAAKRAETEKLRAAGATVANPNTSRRKIAMKEKQKAEENDIERAIARGEVVKTANGKYVKTEKKKENPSAVGDRPYARGRNYKPDRFSKNYVPEPETEEERVTAEELPAGDAIAADSTALPTAAEGTEGTAPETGSDAATEAETGAGAQGGSEAED